MNYLKLNTGGKIIRIFAVILAVAMVFAMASGCRKSEPLYEPPEFVYVSQSVPLPGDVGDINNVVYFDGRVYFTAYTYRQGDESEYYGYTSETLLYSMNTDGTGVTKLNNYQPAKILPPGAFGGCYINRLCIDGEGNLWVVENIEFYRLNLPADFNEELDQAWNYYESLESGSAIRKLDSTGREILSVDLSRIAGQQEYFYISAFDIDGSGNIYMAADNYDRGGRSIYVLDENGNMQFELSTDSWFNQFVRMADGSVAYTADENDEAGNWSRILQKINFNAKAMGESIKIPVMGWDVFPGGGDYDILIADNNNVYGFTEGNEEAEKLLNWLESDIVNNGIQNISILPDNRIICTNWVYDRLTYESGYELIILTRTPYNELPQKTVITLATLYMGNYRDAIVSFNRTSNDYRIAVIDYSEFNSQDDWNAGLNRLNTELISGKVPDILDVSNLSYKQYAARGLLADLYTFIDSDPEYSRSDFVEGAFRAAEIEGKLYQVFPQFYVNTIAGNPSVIGPEPGWTMEEFKAVLDAHPEADMPLGQWLTKTSFLQAAISFGIDEYINWGTGKVTFNTPDFISLLEFSNTMPDDVDWEEFYRSGGNFDEAYISQEEAIATGRQIMMQTQIFDLYNVQWTKAMFGGEIVFKGFPNENRSGNSLNVSNGLAIIDKSKNKDAAWSFVRTVLDKDWQLSNSWGMLTNKAAFDTQAKTAMEQDYSGGGVAVPMTRDGAGYYEPQIQNITQADINQIMDLISSASGTAGWNLDETIWEIISEEVAGYFNGTRSAEDTARFIQNRVQTLVSERS